MLLLSLCRQESHHHKRLKTKKGCSKRCDKTVSSGDTHKSILYQLKSADSKYKFSKAEAPKKSAFLKRRPTDQGQSTFATKPAPWRNLDD